MDRTRRTGTLAAVVMVGEVVMSTLLSGTTLAQVDIDEQRVITLIASRQDRLLSTDISRAVAAQLNDLPISFQIEWVQQIPADVMGQLALIEQIATQTDALATVWYDFGEAKQMVVFLATENGRRFLARRVTGVTSSAIAESVAVITRASVDALLSGGEITIGRVVDAGAMSGDTQVVEPPRTRRSAAGLPNAAHAYRPSVLSQPGSPIKYPWLAISSAYAMRLIARSPLISHRGRFGMQARIVGLFHLLLSYSFVASIKSETGGIRLEMKRHPIQFGGALLTQLGPVRLGAVLSAGFEVINEKISAVAQHMVPAPSRRWIQSAMIMELRVSAPIHDHFWIFGTVGAAVPINRMRYTVDIGHTRLPLIEPWPVQPQLLLGISAAIF